MSRLLVKAGPENGKGHFHRITPESAGWAYVGFETALLGRGEALARREETRETCIVMLAGKAEAEAGGRAFGLIGGRENPFEPEVWSFFVPAGMAWRLVAPERADIAICTAPGRPGLPARVIAPADVGCLTRGSGSNTRHVRNILPETEPAESLLVVEVVTPSGCWSSYPSHRHERDNLPHESLLEETYYHRFSPPQGFGMQRVYTDDRSLDEAMAIEDRDVVLVPRGYHPVAPAHGYDLYYLNVMAGPKRIWKFHNDPAHEWLMQP